MTGYAGSYQELYLGILLKVFMPPIIQPALLVHIS
jgi:hypothetical protein